MIQLPQAILEQLIMYCKANGLAVCQMGNNLVGIVMIGKQDEISATEAAILSAHILLNGVVTGVISSDNDKAKAREAEEDSTPTPKWKVN